MTPREAIARYHAAESRLREVEAEFRAWKKRKAWEELRPAKQRATKEPRRPSEPLMALILERERLQAESFRVFLEARRSA